MTALGKSLLAGILIIIAAIVAFYFYASNNVVQAPVVDTLGFTATTSPQETTAKLGPDPANSTYTLDSTSYSLVTGKVELVIASSSAKDIVKIFTSASGDINGDGKQDAAVILTQNSDGSGTFYYVAAAINVGGKYQGTNAILLGDRIAPQTLEIKNGVVVANYATRKDNEPMTTQPSIGATLYADIENGQLVQIRKPDSN